MSLLGSISRAEGAESADLDRLEGDGGGAPVGSAAAARF